MSRLFLFETVAMLLSVQACTAPVAPLPSRCEAIEIDAMRELVVTDVDVVSDPALAFARVMSAVLGQPSGIAVRAWMDSWAAMPGEAAIASEVTGPWATSSANGLDLSQAPFELIAIANRIDLSTLGPGRAGELRFVYGLVTSGVRRPVTVNVELQLPRTRTAREWAKGLARAGAPRRRRQSSRAPCPGRRGVEGASSWPSAHAGWAGRNPYPSRVRRSRR